MASLIEDNQHAADTLGEVNLDCERLVYCCSGIYLHTWTKVSFRDR